MKNAGQRLVSYLLEQHKSQKTHWLTLPVAHSVLAGQLNIAPETLSRLFKSLRQLEAISGKRETVVLLDIEKMCEFVKLAYASASDLNGEDLPSMAGCCNLSPKWF